MKEEIKPNQIKEFVVDDDNLSGILEAVSLVENPAIEIDYIYFSKDKKTFSTNEEKRIVAGIAMVPDKLIYRNNGEEEFYGYFTAETIKKCAYQFMKEKRNDMVTIQHQSAVDDVYVIESWIVEDSEKDKINTFGIEAPVGSWCLMMKVENDQVWADVKAGKCKAYSIEGFFGLATKQKSLIERIKDAIEAGDIELVKNLLK